MKRIEEKISEIGQFLEELSAIAPATIGDYKSDLMRRAACERYVEKIVEAVTDVAFLTIKAKKFRIPEDDADAFTILLENKVINDALAKKLRHAKGMKNIIAHQYGRIDDEIVFAAINEELDKDVREFIRVVSEAVEK